MVPVRVLVRLVVVVLALVLLVVEHVLARLVVVHKLLVGIMVALVILDRQQYLPVEVLRQFTPRLRLRFENPTR